MKFKLIAALLGLMVAIPGAVFAQSANDQVPDQDLQVSPMDPSSNGSGDDQTYNTPAPAETNGVARVSLIHGDVSTQRGDNGEWSAAALNAPVLAGDRVSTGDKARTELQLDYANMLRLAEHSQANINTLTRSQIQIQMGRGMGNYTVLKNSDADAEIDTPNVAIRTDRRESSFRILVTADDHTEVLVRRGEVEITTPQGGTRVTQGQFITVQGIGDQAQYKIGEAPARDDWDQWNTDRDNMISNSASRRNTNDYYVGTEDLDAHGTWSEVPDYGRVWRPTVTDPDWAPYRDGRWVYEPYWGWTWVSYDDWGWAPYHYGRWMMVDGGWGWWPGPVYGYPFYRPIWAPAYVSFFGWGGGLGVGFGGGWGSVGWLPLGPCDRFHPWWGGYGGRFGQSDLRGWNRGGFAPLHGGNRFSNVNLALHDQHFRGGTTVSGNEFGRGGVRGRTISHDQFQNAHFTGGRVPMRPSRESFSASGRAAAPSTTRNVQQNQRFFSARGTNAAPRSIERGQSQISGARKLEGSPNGNGRGFSRPGNSGSNNGLNTRPGNRSNNGSGNISNNRSGNSSNNSSNNGFRRFGESGPNNVGSSRSTFPTNNGPARPEPRGNSNWGTAPRPGNSGGSISTRERGNSNRGGWQTFTPMPSRPSSGPARPEARGRSEDRSSYGSPSRNAGPQSRGYSPDNRGYSGSSRPPLNMRQPIVTPRPYGGGGYSGGPSGGNRGGYSGGGARPAPSYSGGGRSAPSSSGGHSTPSGGAPRGGGGSSHGSGSPHVGGGGSRHGR